MVMAQSIRNANEPWTEDDIAELAELAAGNIPPCVIGLRLGRPEAAVRAKAAEAGITLQPDYRPPYGT